MKALKMYCFSLSNSNLDKIKKIILDLSKNGKLVLPEKLDGITAEIPPSKFDSDISTNVAMVLSKVNQKTPFDVADIIVEAIKQSDELIENITNKNILHEIHSYHIINPIIYSLC